MTAISKPSVIVRPRFPGSVSPADVAALLVLNRFHYLSAGQMCRLLYSPGSLTYVQAMLKQLTDAGYCQRLFLPRVAAHGSAPAIYRLARKGRQWLRGEGLLEQGRYRPSEELRHSYLFFEHTLGVNDVLIAAVLLAREFSDVRVHELKHERELRHEPMDVPNSNGARTHVIPDGYVDFRIAEKLQSCLLLEYDRGTEDQAKWRAKIAALTTAVTSGVYQTAFGTNSLTVTVVTIPQPQRLTHLIAWTEAQLIASGAQHLAELFRFTDVSPQTVSPEEFFLSPGWLTPFAAEPLPALDIR